MIVEFQNDWGEIFAQEFRQDYFQNLNRFLIEEYKEHRIYPPQEDIFNAFHLTAFKDVKAVILGQDPYHRPGQAHGLAFSVGPSTPRPPSLLNIFKELSSDLGCSIPAHGCLQPWGAEGVLLLNTILTVREGQPNSHRSSGWSIFTDFVISQLNLRKDPIVFLLWGAHAISKSPLITNSHHAILTASHPSPLSAYNGFFGCRHFSKTNALLQSWGKSPIQWQLPEIQM